VCTPVQSLVPVRRDTGAHVPNQPRIHEPGTLGARELMKAEGMPTVLGDAPFFLERNDTALLELA
jgi:hypothetical protein